MGLALPLYGNGSQTLHTVLPLRDACSCGASSPRGSSTSCTSTRPTTRASSCSRRSSSPQGTSASAPTTPSSRPGACATSCTRPTRASLSRLHGHIVVSDACIEPLDHYFPEFDWRVIPNGIDEDHFAPARAPIDALRESGDPVVLFLGRFDPRNGLGIMLEAFDQVWRARDGPRAPVRRRRRPAAPVLREPARARGRRCRALGGPHRLEPPALLRLGRRVLHALPARQLRHGAARGDELRPPGRRRA